MVVTNDQERAEKLKIFRNHGSKPKYYHKFISGNLRLDTIHATIVLAKLPHLDSWSEARKRNADRYRRLFNDRDLLGNGAKFLPEEVTNRHIYNQFVIRVERRDKLQEYLKEQGIGSEVYYPVPFHLQECFTHLRYKLGDFPEDEKAANETLALPIYPELTGEQEEYVMDCIADFFK